MCEFWCGNKIFSPDLQEWAVAAQLKTHLCSKDFTLDSGHSPALTQPFSKPPLLRLWPPRYPHPALQHQQLLHSPLPPHHHCSLVTLVIAPYLYLSLLHLHHALLWSTASPRVCCTASSCSSSTASCLVASYTNMPIPMLHQPPRWFRQIHHPGNPPPLH